LLDIETAPHLATVWGLWQQNVAINQILAAGYTLCWAAKWHGSREIKFDSIKQSTPKQMTARIHRLLAEADAVVHYNGTKFDIPTLNKEFLLHGMAPPAPYAQIDLLRTARTRFRLASNKLDFVAQQLGLGRKTQHKGHELWLDCMNRDVAAWRVMEKYNRNDVVLLEKVYDRLLPWIKGHPNHSVFNREQVCPHCESDNLHARGTAKTKAGEYQRFQCRDCGTWFRDNRSLAPRAKFLEVA
jgi:hypothetical protein